MLLALIDSDWQFWTCASNRPPKRKSRDRVAECTLARGAGGTPVSTGGGAAGDWVTFSHFFVEFPTDFPERKVGMHV